MYRVLLRFDLGEPLGTVFALDPRVHRADLMALCHVTANPLPFLTGENWGEADAR